MAKKILIIDDEPDVLELAAARLEAAGYEVTKASSGEEGLSCVARERPGLVLLDLLLPGIQGSEVARQLKADSATRDIPIVVFTASACDIAARARALQAADWIAKPFEPAVLLEKVRRFAR